MKKNILNPCQFLLVEVVFLLFLSTFNLQAEDISQELSGQVMSYDQCNDTQYSVINVFDNNINTYFRSCSSFGNWIGLDLGEKHVITQVAYCPRVDSDYRVRLQLGIFEGANQPDFGDAIPLFIIPSITERNLILQNINCSKAFRYVRFVFPTSQVDGRNSYMSELKFYGYASEGNDSVLSQLTNLPTVSIHTVNAQDIVSKEEYVKGIISFIYDNGTKIYTDSLEIRGRGNNSWTHPKKPYRLKLAKSTHLMGLPAKARNWTLINSYGDKTLMRNILAFDFSRKLEMPYTSPAKAVDVVLNGDYKGCYQLCDQLDVRTNRVNIEEMDTMQLTGGYLVEIDAYSYLEAKQFTSKTYSVPVTIKYPDEDVLTSAQAGSIESYFNKLTDAVYSQSYMSLESGFRKYLDVETFLRHFLVGEYTGNTDTYWSVYMTKKRDDDKFYFGPVWDFDLGFENDQRTYSITDRSIQNNEWLCFWNESSAAGGSKNMISRIMSDPDLQKRLKEIYSYYREKNIISKIQLEEVVDSCAVLLENSQKLNFMRWPILNSLVHENPVVYGSYDGEVDNVRNYISNRIDWLDNKLNYVTGSTVTNNPIEMKINIWSSKNTIHLSNLPETCALRIIDIYGITRAEEQNVNEFTVSLSSGVYLIIIKDGLNTHTYKYIVL